MHLVWSYSLEHLREAFRKKSSEYNENGTKGGGVSDLNHYLKQLLNSEKGV